MAFNRNRPKPILANLAGYTSGTIIDGSRHRRLYTDLTVRQMLYRVVRKQGSVNAAARVIGITRRYLWDILQGHKPVGPRVAEFFHLKRYIIFLHTEGTHSKGFDGNGKDRVEWDWDGKMVLNKNPDGSDMTYEDLREEIHPFNIPTYPEGPLFPGLDATLTKDSPEERKESLGAKNPTT